MSEIYWLKDLELALKSANLDSYGVQPVGKPVSLEFYKAWLRDGNHAEMTYLKDHLESKSDVTSLLKTANSLVSVLIPYTPHPKPRQLPLKALKVARYARGEDYHHWFLSQLQSVADSLQKKYPEEEFLCFSDSKPILEKEWAARNNLGWIGKNSLLLHPKLGSLFFIGEIVTSLKSENSAGEFNSPDLCGKCTACVESCPTDAILEDRSLDARKCLAYWNIESKSPAPVEVRKSYEGWIFGCDICQEVCPWNNKVFQKQQPKPAPSHEDLIADLKYILTSSNKKLQKDFKGTPVTRAGGKGLKRSALAIAGGWKLTELKTPIETIDFGNKDLEDMKVWALNEMATSDT
ncbi:MAG: tRNA epoxyqueuosine(34) reductase QueG [Pseudomonadota bacterium]